MLPQMYMHEFILTINIVIAILCNHLANNLVQIYYNLFDFFIVNVKHLSSDNIYFEYFNNYIFIIFTV